MPNPHQQSKNTSKVTFGIKSMIFIDFLDVTFDIPTKLHSDLFPKIKPPDLFFFFFFFVLVL